MMERLKLDIPQLKREIKIGTIAIRVTSVHKVDVKQLEGILRIEERECSALWYLP